MARMLFAFAKCGFYHPHLYRYFMLQLQPFLHVLTPHHLSQVLWAFATHSYSSPSLMARVAEAVTSDPTRFCTWDISMIVWSFAKLATPAPQLFEAVWGRVEASLDSLALPALRRMAWAFTQAQALGAEELSAMVQELQPPMPPGMPVPQDSEGAESEPEFNQVCTYEQNLVQAKLWGEGHNEPHESCTRRLRS
jgi:hypothetical protein